MFPQIESQECGLLACSCPSSVRQSVRLFVVQMKIPFIPAFPFRAQIPSRLRRRRIPKFEKNLPLSTPPVRCRMSPTPMLKSKDTHPLVDASIQGVKLFQPSLSLTASLPSSVPASLIQCNATVLSQRDNRQLARSANANDSDIRDRSPRFARSLARSMDPDSKRRISRSLGSLDDILVTLERLKQGPGFSRATAEVEVTNGTPPGGGEGEGEDGEESRESEAAGTERSRSREEGGGGDAEQRGSRGKVLQPKIPSSPKTPSALLPLFSLKHEARASLLTL